MPDYLFLMHRIPAASTATGLEWEPYLAKLRATGCFQGGSAIGAGICAQKAGTPPGLTHQLSGFIRVSASDLDDAKALLVGNPVFEHGGVVEIRELPTDGSPARPVAGAQDREGESRLAAPFRIENRAEDDACFHNCSMPRSRFDDVNLCGSVFTDVNLRDARFDNVNLTGVVITNANIDGMTVFGHDIQILLRREIAPGGT